MKTREALEARVKDGTLFAWIALRPSALLRTKGNVIGAVTPFEHHGMHGREITHTSGDGQAFRSRMFIVGHRGYHISVSSMDPALITRETATRILD